MELTVVEKHTITSTFLLLDQAEKSFAKLFYDCLFELAPMIKPMFKSDRQLIEQHFFIIFSTAVGNVTHPESLRTTLLNLGERHRAYGVESCHFGIVKSALLLAIQHELKGQCNANIENAWSKYYDFLAATIQEGMLSQSHIAQC
ncbi:globin domain-containing protein [Rheinheimera riviphila]|nr:globin domain-containing protein [Rheinheimera riviphila]